MNNVYAQVQAFYDEAPHLTPLSQECVDGFLRQLAWQGKNAAELICGNAYTLITYRAA